MRLVLVLCMALVVVAGAQAVDLEGDELARYHDLTAELRCVICQNRNIAESDAPLAADMRKLVAGQIADGRSDDQIKQYLVDRYGEWVLYDPPLGLNTLILWAGPFLLLALALLIGALLMRRRREVAETTPALDRERLARVLHEHDRRSARDDADSSRDT